MNNPDKPAELSTNELIDIVRFPPLSSRNQFSGRWVQMDDDTQKAIADRLASQQQSMEKVKVILDTAHGWDEDGLRQIIREALKELEQNK